MHQLDLFEYQPKPPEILLLKGSNFLLLPAKKSRFEPWEVLAVAIFVLASLLNSNVNAEGQRVFDQKAVLGAFDNPQLQTAEAAVNTQSLPPIPMPPPPLPPAVIPKPVPKEKIHVPVLMYHHVGEPPTQNSLDRSLTVSASDFEQQVAFFKNHGYQSVTLAQTYAALEQGATFPSNPIVFTFDDGYKDVFVNAVPILKKHGFVGTFAVAPALLEANEYATWGDVYLAYQNGMEIVSHSMNHVDFSSSSYSDDFLMVELQGSKLFLESRISAPVDFFVYPYGRYNDHVIELVKKAGYKMAFTTELGTEMNLNQAYHLPRVRVHSQDGLTKLKKILGL